MGDVHPTPNPDANEAPATTLPADGETPVGPVAWLLIQIVRFYKFAISPMLGNHCRFHPTCSQYFILAVRKYGALRGTALGVGRILRCHPFCRGGVDFP
jgi:putative membrane protein insertion efficiency factor